MRVGEVREQFRIDFRSQLKWIAGVLIVPFLARLAIKGVIHSKFKMMSF